MDKTAVEQDPIDAVAPPPETPRTAYRHRLPTRIWHWIDAVAVFVLLMSGLMMIQVAVTARTRGSSAVR